MEDVLNSLKKFGLGIEFILIFTYKSNIKRTAEKVLKKIFLND